MHANMMISIKLIKLMYIDFVYLKDNHLLRASYKSFVTGPTFDYHTTPFRSFTLYYTAINSEIIHKHVIPNLCTHSPRNDKTKHENEPTFFYILVFAYFQNRCWRLCDDFHYFLVLIEEC